MGSPSPSEQDSEDLGISLEYLTLRLVHLLLSHGSLSSPMDTLLRSGGPIVGKPDRLKVWAPSFLVDVPERLEWEFLLPRRASGNVASWRRRTPYTIRTVCSQDKWYNGVLSRNQ